MRYEPKYKGQKSKKKKKLFSESQEKPPKMIVDSRQEIMIEENEQSQTK